MTPLRYVGRAVLTRGGHRFRGRVLRNQGTGAYRFCVNRRSNGKVPPEWPHKEDCVDDVDLAAVEWVGKTPEGL